MKIDNFFNEHFGNLITVVDVDQKVWFVGNQVAGMLGYKHPNMAVQKHVHKKFKRMFTYAETQYILKNSGVSKSFTRENQYNIDFTNSNGLMFINEPGVYSLIFKSKLPAAEEFQIWVFEEVLPSIRKSGIYIDESHVAIRLAGILIRKFETRAISKFLKYSKSLGYNYNDSIIYAKLTILTNKISDIITGQRNFSPSFNLLICMLMEAKVMDVLYNGILYKYEPAAILKICKSSIIDTLFDFISRINKTKSTSVSFDNNIIRVDLDPDNNIAKCFIGDDIEKEIKIYEDEETIA